MLVSVGYGGLQFFYEVVVAVDEHNHIAKVKLKSALHPILCLKLCHDHILVLVCFFIVIAKVVFLL